MRTNSTKTTVLLALFSLAAFAQQTQEQQEYPPPSQQELPQEYTSPPQEPTAEEYIPPPQEPLQQQVQPPQVYIPPPQVLPQQQQAQPPQEQIQYQQPPQGYIPPQQVQPQQNIQYQQPPQGYIPPGYIPAPQGYPQYPPQGYIPYPEQQQQAQQQPQQPPQPVLKDSVQKDSVSKDKDTGKGFYFRLIGGYAFGAGEVSGVSRLSPVLPAKSVVSSSRSEYRDSFGTIKVDEKDSKTTEKNESFSLGEGMQIGVGIGYMFNRNIGIDLRGNYLSSSYTVENKSSTYSFRHETFSLGNNRAGTIESTQSDSESETYTIDRTCIMLIPALRFVAPISDAFSLYSVVGISIPISDEAVYKYEKHEYHSYDYTNSTTSSAATRNRNSSQEYKEQEFTPYFELGYSASLGLNVAFGKVVNLFVEANVNTSSFEVKEGTITEWTSSSTNSNGNPTSVDMLKNMDARDKKTKYEKDFSKDNNNPSSDKDSPKKEASFSLPASNIGVNAGLMFKF